MGSAEIYSVLEGFTTEVEDSLCVAQRRPEDKDERVLLFLKMREGHKFNHELAERIRKAIRQARSPRHVPSFIFPIEDIPVSVHPSLLAKCAVLIICVISVHREWQEDRDCSKADRVWIQPETQWDRCQPRVLEALLQVPQSGRFGRQPRSLEGEVQAIERLLALRPGMYFIGTEW